ncbi:MAG: EAL domain-containing protein [Alphaproteobacteria bacterium]|nr:EAL domain-containing protein [Alphaproteobacteria bacterium]MBU0795957.1 EAL domain-containing protein [Alphaproteobacteria bacterium]MBU0886486.1 EAL domain-containing protein [Alphaproteobacteria bacterium]MBU1812291.1 EAL domain-containing protein [Alphaproteobacteria bacterium]MBU2091756.1 EAL domain-containing protein [Alphaproteobacteria bacterium]
MSCLACAGGGAVRDDTHRLLLWAPQAHTRKKLHSIFTAAGVQVDDRTADALLDIRKPDLSALAGAIRDAVYAAELEDTRALVLDTDAEPDLRQFSAMTTLERLLSRAEALWVDDLIDEKRYVSFMQPIVAMDAAHSVFGYEFLFRGQEADGSLIPPTRIFGAARDPGLMLNLDRVARINAVETAARHTLKTKLFINFMPRSIYDPDFCLRSTAAAIERAEVSPDQVVFEVVEIERMEDYDHLLRISDFYRKAGFEIALDDFGSGYNNLSTLLTLKPNYIKLDKILTSDLDTDESKRRLVKSLVATAHEAGVIIIAEGVETQVTADILRDIRVDYCQGYFFGRPQPMPLAA